MFWEFTEIQPPPAICQTRYTQKRQSIISKHKHTHGCRHKHSHRYLHRAVSLFKHTKCFPDMTNVSRAITAPLQQLVSVKHLVKPMFRFHQSTGEHCTPSYCSLHPPNSLHIGISISTCCFILPV